MISWESVAFLLRQEDASDVELADRLGCGSSLIAGVRESLGMPPFPRRLRPLVAAEKERFDELSAPARGGHRVWLGRFTQGGVPLFSPHETVHQVVFRLTHQQEPVGKVRVACGFPHCVEGPHQADRIMRDAARLPGGASYGDIDLNAVRRALTGLPPHPPLTPKEQRYAFTFAAGIGPAELAARLGVSKRTIDRWRAHGVPK